MFTRSKYLVIIPFLICVNNCFAPRQAGLEEAKYINSTNNLIYRMRMQGFSFDTYEFDKILISDNKFRKKRLLYTSRVPLRDFNVSDNGNYCTFSEFHKFIIFNNTRKEKLKEYEFTIPFPMDVGWLADSKHIYFTDSIGLKIRNIDNDSEFVIVKGGYYCKCLSTNQSKLIYTTGNGWGAGNQLYLYDFNQKSHNNINSIESGLYGPVSFVDNNERIVIAENYVDGASTRIIMKCLLDGTEQVLWSDKGYIDNLSFIKSINGIIFSTGRIHEENRIYLLRLTKDIALLKKYANKIYWVYNNKDQIIITQYFNNKPEFLNINKF